MYRNLVINQGSTFSYTFALVDTAGDPVDVSGATANANMRKEYSSNTTYAFTTALANGGVTISMTANATANVPAPGNYVYDVLFTSAGVKTRVAEGQITVNPSVSR